MRRVSFAASLRLLCLFVGILAVILIFNHAIRNQKISSLIGSEIPVSTTEINYVSSTGWGGEDEYLCISITKIEFARIVANNSLMKSPNLIEDTGNIFAAPLKTSNLWDIIVNSDDGICWEHISRNLDEKTYSKTIPNGLIAAKYDGGKMIFTRKFN